VQVASADRAGDAGHAAVHRRHSPGGLPRGRRGIAHEACAVLLALGSPVYAEGSALETMVRWWAFRQILSGASRDEPLGPEQQQVGGTVDDRRLLGSLALHPPGVDQDAWGEVFADETGGTYWVSTQAPSPMGTGGAIGGSSELLQYQYFRKTDSDAELRLVVSRVFVEAIDGNPGFPTATECHWHQPGASYVDCGRVMWGRVNFRVTAFDFFDDAPFLQTGGFAEITGWRGFFAYNAQTDHDATVPFWDRSRFFFDPDYDDEGGGRAQLVLDAPIAIEVPLSSVGIGDLFYVAVNARAFTLNLRQRESYLSAYFRPGAVERPGALLQRPGSGRDAGGQARADPAHARSGL
jgi:hypothetical protein